MLPTAARRAGLDSGEPGSVENKLPPALPHQTVHAVFPHTAFRCSSHLGMRRFPARYCLNFPVLPGTGVPRFHDFTLYGVEVDPVYAGTASVGPNKPPSVTEDVFPADLVVERVKAVGRLLLGLGC